ncbi:glycoside hydrolase superfamily [Triangularia verruculosa]|uniref:Alpha-amylase n=1 Tax=Triangularia verruculosa TaxID=2587418 RepID=A0AAN6X9N9_9PEZI|nr:glycoside hydrolase superfamily [Triangularia verruculosa]
MRSSLLSLAGVASLAFAGLGLAADAEEWKTRSVYQVMIDRYARTDGSISHECEAHEFCGGTWRGLINKLDYIQDMGFTAIQISPINKNMEEHTSVGDPYHGYWTTDLYALNDKFGTEKDFKDLVDELKKRDIYLMADVVVNHMAQKFDNKPPPKVDFSKFNPFNDEKYFHPYCNVTDWENSTDYQDCWLYPYGVVLADLDTRNEFVIKEMNSWIKGLVSNYSIDGLRIDAAKHVNDEFLPPFVKASGVFAWGEVLTGEPEDFCRYQTLNLLPGMPNYLDYYKLVSSFNGGNFEDLARIKKEAINNCNDTFALGTFVENHDMPRFANKNSDMAIAENAMTYVILNDGVPTVYQGQEQHFDGFETPHNREPLWQSGYDKESPLYKLTATLNRVRNNAIKLDKEYVNTASEILWANNNHFCTKKGAYGSQIVYCITNQSSKGPRYELSVGGFQAEEQVVEVLTCKANQAGSSGNITMFMNNGAPKVYVPAGALKGTGLCEKTTADAYEEDSGAGVTGAATGLLAAAIVGWAALFLA